MATSRIPAGDRNLYANDGQKLASGEPKPPAFILGDDDFCMPANTRSLSASLNSKGKRVLLTKKVTPGNRDGGSLTVAFTLDDGEVVIETATLCLPAKSKDAGVLQFPEPSVVESDDGSCYDDDAMNDAHDRDESRREYEEQLDETGS
jgi:hypothetical protein